MHFDLIYSMLTVFCICAVMVSVLIPLIVRYAVRNKIYDVPDARKVHTGNVPRLGGLAFLPAIFLAFVENGGEPIPPDALPHLFERFYRADASRSDHDSFGLGLSIAQAITKNHGGTIRVESDQRSTRFIVALPLKRS